MTGNKFFSFGSQGNNYTVINSPLKEAENENKCEERQEEKVLKTGRELEIGSKCSGC